MPSIKKRPPIKGKVKIIDPQPIWVGVSKGTTIKHHFHSPSQAEQWLKQDPINRRLVAETTVANLQAQPDIDQSIPEWEPI